MGTFAPLLLRAQDPDDGVGPYSVLFLFAVAVALSTFVFNLFFMNLPVEGDPLEIPDYFRTSIRITCSASRAAAFGESAPWPSWW